MRARSGGELSAHPLHPSDLRPLGALASARANTRGGLALGFDGAAGELSVALDGSIRLRIARGRELPSDLGAALGRPAWPLATIDARNESGEIAVSTGSAEGGSHIVLAAQPFSLRVETRDGRELATLAHFRLGASAHGGGSVRLASGVREHVFGLGEKSGPMDRRGRATLLRNQDPEIGLDSDALYASIPFALLHDVSAGRSRGILLDTLGAAFVDAAASDASSIELTCAFGALDVVVYPGPKPADVLRRFTAHVGRSAIPPRWALGHHQSRWSYRTQREVLAIARELRERGIPSDAIHLDIDHMRGYRVFTWDARRFPDPAAMTRELASRDLRAVAITDPGVKVDDAFALYREGRERGYFVNDESGAPFALRVWPGDSALPDFGREDVRAWWAQHHAPLLDAGVAGIWADMNEPAGWKRDLRFGTGIPLVRPGGQVDFGKAVQRSLADREASVPHESIRNAYGLSQVRASRDALLRAHPGERPFVLSRAGCQGIQQFAALWTGDSFSRFEDLRESVRMLLGLSASGVAFCGADIGGFAGNATPELYARWVQIGALYPFARTHSMWASRRQEPWSFGRRVEHIAREALALRMRLIPYLSTLLRDAAETGAPVWRPLFYEFPDDGESVFCEDQVMLGPWLLAAPVLERGARERDVYLPPGVWLDWYDDARHVGPKRLRVPAPLERLPLFARAGAAIPLQSPELSTAARPREPLVVEVFPGADGQSVLAEDDGSSADGPVTRTRMRVRDRAAGRLRLEIARRDGDYDVGERTVRVCFRGVGRPSEVRLGGEPLPRGHALPSYRCESGRVHVRFRDAGEVHTIELEPAP